MKTSEAKKMFPKKGAKITVDDFYQYAVDEFEQGYFKFISIWKKTVLMPFNSDSIIGVDPNGFLVTVFCYDSKRTLKILICDYQVKPFANNYHARMRIAEANKCDFAFNDSLEDIAGWFSVSTKKYNRHQ